MYGLPAGEDFGFFVGLTLDQICVGRYQLIFNFESTALSAEGTVGVETPGSAEQQLADDFRFGASSVCPLISQRVTTVSPASDGTLSLTFEDGTIVRFYDSSDRYESYVINHGRRVIVV